MTDTGRINLGVVGCGYWGPNLIRNFRSLPGCRMRFMCDVSTERVQHLKTLYPEVEGTLDFEALARSPEVDAIAIATPVKYHYPMAKACLTAGKHTMIEKPMAASVEQCEELIELAKKHGVVLMVGHTFLYSAPVRRIKETIDRGEIGALQYITSRRLNLGLFQKDINVTWDLAPHDISIVNYLIGESPISVNCWGNAHIARGIEDVTSLHVLYKGDRFASIQSSWLDPRKIRDMTIVGKKRMIVYDDVQPLEKIRIYDTRVEVPPHYDTFAEFQYSYHYGDSYIPYVKQEEPLKVECQHFLDCIKQGKTPLTSGRAGMEVVKVLEAASASLKDAGRAIALNSEGPGSGPGKPPGRAAK
jgi:predicted dehydrogenase